MKPHPEVIELDEEELQAKLSRIEAGLGSEFVKPFRQLLDGYVTLLGLPRDKNISIQRLRKLIFGGSSERSSKIMPEEEGSSEPETDTAADDVAAAAENSATEQESNPSHRRNSLFYKTMGGAGVGDLYMSLIHTCYLCGADPFHDLTQLQRNGDRVTAAPGDWLPWNYQKQVDTEGTNSSRPPPRGTAASSSQ